MYLPSLSTSATNLFTNEPTPKGQRFEMANQSAGSFEPANQQARNSGSANERAGKSLTFTSGLYSSSIGHRRSIPNLPSIDLMASLNRTIRLASEFQHNGLDKYLDTSKETGATSGISHTGRSVTNKYIGNKSKSRESSAKMKVYRTRSAKSLEPKSNLILVEKTVPPLTTKNIHSEKVGSSKFGSGVIDSKSPEKRKSTRSALSSKLNNSSRFKYINDNSTKNRSEPY